MRKKNKKTALMTAADLLSRQEQSSEILRRKLLHKKFSADEVEQAIEILIERNYLDDVESCRRQFENFYSQNKLSVRQICAKLIQRGFEPEFVQNLIPQGSEEHDLEIAMRLAEKKIAQVNFDSLDAKEKYKLKSKIYQNLASKGFTSEVITTAIEKFL